MSGQNNSEPIDVDLEHEEPSLPAAIVDAEAAPTVARAADIDGHDLGALMKTITASSWSVPVEDKGTLDKLFWQAMRAVDEGTDDTSERCHAFYNQGVTTSFDRLMLEKAVKGWNNDTLNNVFRRVEQFLQFFVSPHPNAPRLALLRALARSPARPPIRRGSRFRAVRRPRSCASAAASCRWWARARTGHRAGTARSSSSRRC